MRCHSLLQGIFPTQGSNPGLLHCRQILYRLSRHHCTVIILSFCGDVSFPTDGFQMLEWQCLLPKWRCVLGERAAPNLQALRKKSREGRASSFSMAIGSLPFQSGPTQPTAWTHRDGPDTFQGRGPPHTGDRGSTQLPHPPLPLVAFGPLRQ